MLATRNHKLSIQADAQGFCPFWREGGPSRLSEYNIGFAGLCSLGDQRASSTRLSDQDLPLMSLAGLWNARIASGKETLTVRPQPAL